VGNVYKYSIFSLGTLCHSSATGYHYIKSLKKYISGREDDVVDEDIILLWSDQKIVITGSDILGRLLRGIMQNKNTSLGKTVAVNEKR